MPSSLITLLVVALVCLLLGAIAGMLLGSSGGNREEDDLIAEEAPPGGRKGRYSVLVRLWREKSGGALVVEVDGKSYLAPDPLRPDQRERLAQAFKDFALWLGTSPAEFPSQGIPPVVYPAAPVQSAPPVQPPVQAAQPAQPARSSLIPPKPVEASPKPVVQPPPPAVPAQPVPAKSSKSPIPPAKEKPKSMVEQINAVLQQQIAGTPYETRGLSIAEDPIRGVLVWVGPVSFEGIGGVQDPEIQGVLRAAVAEWERQQDAATRRKP